MKLPDQSPVSWQLPIIQALSGIALAIVLLLLPIPVFQLIGAIILVALPGYWTWRLLGFFSPLASPFIWAAVIFTVFAVVPIGVNFVAMLLGLNFIVIVLTLVFMTLIPAVLFQRRQKETVDHILDESIPTWVYVLVTGLGIFLGLMVVMSYAPILTIKGLPWVTMGDWDKHGAIIWTLSESGVPPEDFLIGSNPSITFTYYYLFHLIPAQLHILTRQHFDLRWIFIVPTVALAFALPTLLFVLAQALLKRLNLAVLVTFFVTLVGGLDLVAVAILLDQESLSLLKLINWVRYLHIESWANPTGLNIIGFYNYFIWVPHHLAALGLLVAAWILWMRRPAWRALRFWFPILFASMIGFSVYVSIAAMAGLVVWLGWEGLVLLREDGVSQLRQQWKTWILRGLGIAVMMTILAAPMLWQYWQGSSPGRGVAFESPALAVAQVFEWLTQAPLNSTWWRPLHFALQYFLDLGVGLLLLIFGIYITARAYWSQSWANQYPDLTKILTTSSWRWIFSTGVTALILITFFVSAGSSQEALKTPYGTLNDFGMRVVMPTQITIGILAALFIMWWSRHRWKRYLLPLIFVGGILIVLGLGATGWEMSAMAFAKYRLGWAIPNEHLQALDYVRQNAPQSARFQQPIHAWPETYLIAQRRPVLWGRTAMLLSADQPRAYRLNDALRQAYMADEPERSYQLFKENNVNLFLVTPQERSPQMNPDKFNDTHFYRLAFDNSWGQIYQLTDEEPIPQVVTLAAQAKRASDAGEIDKARELYEEAVATESNPGLRKDILIKWGILERFNDPEKAALLFEEALDLESDNIELNANYGAVLLKLERFDEAIDAFTFVVTDNPKHYWGWRLLGDAYEKQGDWGNAMMVYEEAVEVANPDSDGQRFVVFRAIASAVRANSCDQANDLAERFATLLEPQAEEIAALLANCVQ